MALRCTQLIKEHKELQTSRYRNSLIIWVPEAETELERRKIAFGSQLLSPSTDTLWIFLIKGEERQMEELLRLEAEQRMHSPSLQPAKSPLNGPQAIEAKGISEVFPKKSGGPTWT